MPRKTLQKRVDARIIQMAGGGGDILEARCGNCGRYLLVFRVGEAPAGLFWMSVRLRIGPGGAVEVSSYWDVANRRGWHTFDSGWGYQWDADERIWRPTPESRGREARVSRDARSATGATRNRLRATLALRAVHRDVSSTPLSTIASHAPRWDESHSLPTGWQCSRCGAGNTIAEANSPCI